MKRLSNLKKQIQEDIRISMDGHEEVFDPNHLCDIIEKRFSEYENIEQWREPIKFKGVKNE